MCHQLSPRPGASGSSQLLSTRVHGRSAEVQGVRGADSRPLATSTSALPGAFSPAAHDAVRAIRPPHLPQSILDDDLWWNRMFSSLIAETPVPDWR